MKILTIQYWHKMRNLKRIREVKYLFNIVYGNFLFMNSVALKY